MDSLNTNRSPSANELAFTAEPLALWNERNTVAFLVNSEIAAVTENYSIGVFTVPIVAYRAFTILFFSCASTSCLAVYSSSRTRPGPMRLWGLWIGFRYT